MVREVKCPWCGSINVSPIYHDWEYYCLDCKHYFDIKIGRRLKDRLPCFGYANTSDACSQCSDYDECVKETVRNWRKAKPAFGKHVEKIILRGLKGKAGDC